MLRVAEAAQRTDTGRQREANEDSFLARAPLFAVADGMGGAQAGEVASRLAVEAFQRADLGGAPPEPLLRETAELANREIFEHAQGDKTRAGMGTTLTAALVHGDEISFGHVGDSRAYVFREGRLKQITNDHSLVEELRRQGRLTRDQAAEHPQRSVITRALGPEPTVDVDTMTFRARAGDTFLLCSDGLTTMLGDDDVAAIMNRGENLERAAKLLIDAANERGGRDNITVVLFRLAAAGARGEGGGAEAGSAATGATAAIAAGGDAARAEDEPAARDDARAGGMAAAGGGFAATPDPAEEETVAGPGERGLSAEEVRSRAARRAARPGERERARESRALAASRARANRDAPAGGRAWPRRLLKGVAALLVVAVLAAAAVAGARQVWFLGTGDDEQLALFRGLPYELPFGIDLYSEQRASRVTLAALPEERRATVVDHELRSEDDAVSLLEDLERSAAVAVAGDSNQGAGGRDDTGGTQQGSGNARGGNDGKRSGGNRAGGGGA